MLDIILDWFVLNKIEITGTVLGLLYIFFSIRQSIFTWPTGLLTSAIYIIVFFQSKFYADMGLQVYYVIISIYGWYFWLFGNKKESNKVLPVRKIGKTLWLKLLVITVLLYIVIVGVLLNFTDSDVPYMDALTTSCSITATWMLAKKYIEQWLIWIFVDLFSAGLYVYKELWPTVILFMVYTILAFVGYQQWKKDLKSQQLETLA